MAQQERRSNENKTSRDGMDILIELVASVVQVGIACYGSYVLSNWIRNKGIQQGQRTPNEEARERLTKMLMERIENSDDDEESNEKVRRKVVALLDLNEYETAIAEDVVNPADITTTFRDVGGIDHIKTELWDLVVLPILRPDLFQSDSGLVTHPKGILLCTFIKVSIHLSLRNAQTYIFLIQNQMELLGQERLCWQKQLRKKVGQHLSMSV